MRAEPESPEKPEIPGQSSGESAQGSASDPAQPSERVPIERNLFLLYGGEGLAKILAIVAFGWITRHVGDPAYGDLETAIAVFFVLNLVMEAGLDPFGAREGAQRPSTLNRLAGGIVYLRLFLLAASLGLLIGISSWVGLSTRPGQLILAYGLVLLPGPVLLNWAFQARDRMNVVAGSTFLRQLVICVGVLLIVRTPADVLWIPVLDALGLLSVACVQNVLFRKSGGRLGPRPEGEELAHIWRDGAGLAGSTFAWATRVFAPTIILRIATSAEDTAPYGAAHRLVVAMHAFAWLYFMNLLPSISRTVQDAVREGYERIMSRSLLTIGWVVLPGFAALVLLAPFLLPRVFGAEFVDASLPFQVAVWMPAVAFLSGHHRYGLIAHGHVGAEFRASLAGALFAVGAATALAVAGRLTPVTTAAVFVGGELATLLTARFAIAASVGAPPLVARLVRPAAATALGLALATLLASGRPILGAAVLLGTAGALAPFLQRDLIPELRALLKAVRG